MKTFFTWESFNEKQNLKSYKNNIFLKNYLFSNKSRIY